MYEKVNSCLENALTCARHGMLVIPVHSVGEDLNCSCGKPDCSAKGKHPIQKNWLEIATGDEERIRQLWELYAYANVGVVAGAKSGVFFLDVDPKNGGNESFEQLQKENGVLPDTVTVITGSEGRHFYLKYPVGKTIRGRINLLPGIDIKSDGGFVVGPGSRHKSGNFYRWMPGRSPDEIAIAEPPDWLEKMINGNVSVKKTGHTNNIPDIIPEGQRDSTLFKIASSLKYKGLGEDEILETLLAINQKRCQPPLSEEEIQNNIVAVVSRYESQNEFFDTPAVYEKIRKAAGGENPAKAIFQDMELLRNLTRVQKDSPGDWALIKAELKGKVSLTDLERTVKHGGLKIVGVDDEPQFIEQIFDNGRGYYKLRMTNDGSVPEALSNFIIEVMERVEMPDGEEYLNVKVTVDGEETFTEDISSNAILTWKDMLKAFNRADMVWLGTDFDIQLLRNHLFKQPVKRVKGTEIVGYHEELILLPGLVIDCNGAVEKPEIRLVNRFGSELLKQTFSLPDEDGHYKAAEALYSYFTRVNEHRITVPAISWAFALPFSYKIRKMPNWRGFPILTVWGTGGSGKTELSVLIMRLCGLPMTYEPLSLPRTKFTRLKSYNSSNFLPIHLDEFRVSNFNREQLLDFYHELRSLYGGEQEERGMKNLKSRVYKLEAPILLSGEDAPRDPALLHRLLVLHPNPDIVNEHSEYRGTFRRLHKAPLESFPVPYWIWALNQSNWLDVLNNEREEVLGWAKHEGFSLPNRIANNLSIARFGWRMFLGYGESIGMQPSDVDSVNLDEIMSELVYNVMDSRKVRTALDNLIVLIASMVVNRRLEYGIHFVKRSDGNVIILLQYIMPEVRKYSRETQAPFDILTEEAIKSMVKESAGKPGSYVLAASERGDFFKISDGREQRRGLMLDPHILYEQLGIDEGIWCGSGKYVYLQDNIQISMTPTDSKIF